MLSEKNAKRVAGLVVLFISALIYYFSVERTGSLWDCGEFVLAAHKLQVVHPPGAPLFIIVGRMFTWVAGLFSDDPASYAFAVNLMSGLCSAFAAMFIAMSTFLLGKIALVGRGNATTQGDKVALIFAGLIAGLTTAFATSVWFSAVEGEVYAMSTFFTAMTLWAVVEWYNLPNEPTHDRWIVFALFSAAMSIGVHLLSLLTFPALVLFYYFKRFKNPNLLGAGISMVCSLLLIGVINKLIIAGIPGLWQTLELFCVNSLGLPIHSGLVPTLLIVIALIFFGLRYAHKHNSGYWQQAFVTFALVVVGFSTIGVVLVRSNAFPPINMNEPTDAMRLLPYLNREQYGERPIAFGPHFNATPIRYDSEERYGRVDDHYEIVDNHITPVYRTADKMLFPRISHNDGRRKNLYKKMWGMSNKPTFAENISFFVRYQVGWMYFRYFLWNFSGRQNGNQGYTYNNVADGNWQTGITPLDEARLHEMGKMPDSMKAHEANNKYYLLPLLFGLLGMIFQLKNKRGDFLTILMLFLITGLGITVFANSPPNEPRERDYIFVGSFITFSIWVGMGVLMLYQLMRERAKMSGLTPALIAGALVITAPIIMGFQNYNDHSRKEITAARDYAANFLMALKPNAVLFTFGDNDTYPLWYAQEVEDVRTDVRVINLSLIGVDWYVNQQRRAINDSPPIKFSIPSEAYRGFKRNQVFVDPYDQKREASLKQALKFCGEHHPIQANASRKLESYIPAKQLYLSVDKSRAIKSGWVNGSDPRPLVDRIPIKLSSKTYLTKGELAVLDILSSNVYDRPIYFNTTIMGTFILGYQDYMQLEGMALRVVPYKTASNRNYSIVGHGAIDVETTYNAIMNDYRWGNFDKADVFVDASYNATQQSHRLSMLRTMNTLAQSGDLKRAADIGKKYLEAFPHNNFPYDLTVVPFIQTLVAANDDAAKDHLRILVNEAVQQTDFFNSLSPNDLRPNVGFASRQASWSQTVRQIKATLNSVKDADFKKKMEDLLAPIEQVPSRN